MTPPLVILILSLLLGMQPLTSDLYLPALPALTDSLGTTLPRAQLSLTALLLAFGVSQLVWGPLSDRFGRRPLLLVFALGSAISFVPMLSTVGMTMSSVLVAVAVNAVLLAAYAGSLAAVMAEQFPAEVRTAGISLPYGIAVAVFGGLTPVLATASLQHDVFWIFQAAMVALCLISAAVFWRMPETSGT